MTFITTQRKLNNGQIVQQQRPSTTNYDLDDNKKQYFTKFWPFRDDSDIVVLDDSFVRWFGYTGAINNARKNMKHAMDLAAKTRHLQQQPKKIKYDEITKYASEFFFETNKPGHLQQITVYVMSKLDFKRFAMVCGNTSFQHKIREYCFSMEDEFIPIIQQQATVTNNSTVCDLSSKKDDFVNQMYAELFPYFKWQERNKAPINDCSIRRRPDYYTILPHHILIMEVDEEQHKQYDPKDENVRINQLSESFNDKPIIYIRFNPDKYTALDGARIGGCFDKINGNLVVNKELLEKRLRVVHFEVLKYCDDQCAKSCLKEALIKQIYLFFDGFNCDF